jgi:hypothetical protein
MEEKFVTKDIYLSAALIALGALYDGADKSEPRHMEFRLVGDRDFDDLHTQWVNGTLTVNAVRFKNALQQLKSVVHSA